MSSIKFNLILTAEAVVTDDNGDTHYINFDTATLLAHEVDYDGFVSAVDSIEDVDMFDAANFSKEAEYITEENHVTA